MNAAEAIQIVRKIAGNVTVFVTEADRCYSHRDHSGGPEKEFCVSILPAPSGEDCETYNGKTLLDCVDAAMTDIIRSRFHADRAFAKPAADGVRCEDVALVPDGGGYEGMDEDASNIASAGG